MNCVWGFSWHSYFHYSWVFWLLVVLVFVGAAYWYGCRRHSNRRVCPRCSARVEAAYLRCPECGQALKDYCPGCGRIVEHDRKTCPHCKEQLQDNRHRVRV
jgi:RNA polymerase subunit RPABC4/transcription elongation factor Spt4